MGESIPNVVFHRSFDDLLLTIKEISETLDQMSRIVDETTAVAATMEAGLLHVDDAFCTPTGAIWRLYNALRIFNLSAAPLTHDIEVAINERRGQWLVSQFDQTPFDVELGDIRITLTPLGSPRLFWVPNASMIIKPDCLVLWMHWQLSGNGLATQKLDIRLELQFLMKAASVTVRVVQSRGARFFRDTGETCDPFLQLPMRDAVRSVVRENVFNQIARRVREFSADLPQNPLVNGPKVLTPHTYTCSGSALILIHRALSKRRTREPLGITLSGQYNQAIRLHRAHIESQLRTEVAAQGANVEMLECRQGYIFLKVHQHRSDGCMWIDIDVDVWFEYSLRILNDTPNRLRAHLNWLSYSWKYEIDNCWPICGDIGSDVEDQINQELPKYYRLSFPFADLRGIADRARAAIEPYGLTIHTEVPNA